MKPNNFMVLDAQLSRPLQRRCTQCRRVQDVRLPALYHVVVPNKGGGTRRDGGYDCRFCGTANIIPATEMPQGLVLQLPSHAEQMAAAADVKGGTIAVPDKIEEPAPAPPPKALPRPVAKRLPPPAWIVGTKAQATLASAFARAKADREGFCTAFVRGSDGALRFVDPRDAIADGDILGWLDGNACELLVLGGAAADGSRWKVVFHPIAGAATLATEPAQGDDVHRGMGS